MSFFDEPAPITIAHRGGSQEAAENSMVAFRRSIELGVKHIELDVQATADGQVFVYHGSKVSRLVHNKLFGLNKAKRHGYKPLLFAQVLKSLPSARLYVDIKNSDAIRPVAELLVRTVAIERVCIGSINRQTTLECGRLIKELSGQDIDMAVLVRSPRHLALQLKKIQSQGFTAVAVLGKTLTKNFVKRAHKNNLKVVVWTINEPSQLQKLSAIGVDAIGTDYPSRFADITF